MTDTAPEPRERRRLRTWLVTGGIAVVLGLLLVFCGQVSTHVPHWMHSLFSIRWRHPMTAQEHWLIEELKSLRGVFLLGECSTEREILAGPAERAGQDAELARLAVVASPAIAFGNVPLSIPASLRPDRIEAPHNKRFALADRPSWVNAVGPWGRGGRLSAWEVNCV